MAQVFTAYLDSEKSERFMLKLAEHWQNTPVKDVTPESIRQAGPKLYPGASPATWNRQVIKPTQAAINLAAAQGWCSKISVPRFRENPKTKTAATLEWVRAFHAQAVKDGLPHLGALCLFMFGTAARIGEACRLTWGEVDLSKGIATLHLTKPHPWSRIAHLPPEVVVALANIPSNRNPADLVFGYAGRASAKDPWGNVIKRAGIDNLTPHCCRHGFATTMLHKGFDVKTVAERGGWKDAATVLRTYAHALEDITVTDAIFGTNPTQAAKARPATNGKQKRKSS